MHFVEELFTKYYGFVCQVIFRYVKDKDKTEDIAQDMFMELWQKKDHWTIHSSPQAYLRKMAVSRALNFLRNNKKHTWETIEDPDKPHEDIPSQDASALDRMEESELAEKIQKAIEDLPEKCRIVFQLSRVEQMPYAEIAMELDISVKTVENQIGKALKLLRNAVSSYRGEPN